ncbi:DUF4342 domain-containing protein [Schaalia naturae]|jgi:hypothetical protein|uniref:DUF4342 domain-containing protein n=1 Tax=Schaalia naturae TaxID=635203 RepID=A0ABW2SQ44_9ACTO
MSEQNQSSQGTSGTGSFTERIEVVADELVSTIKDLVQQGNVRRVTIRDKDGKQLFSLPLTAGVAAGGVAVLALPTLAAIAGIAALVTSTTLEVERTDVVDGGSVVDVDAGEQRGSGAGTPTDGSMSS